MSIIPSVCQSAIVGHIPELDGKKVYEIVRPIKLHELQKRDLKVSSHLPTTKYHIFKYFNQTK